MAELAGRFVELEGDGATSLLTAAVGLVRDAQLEGDLAAWITDPRAAFYPPDVVAHGIDLRGLAIVRAPDLRARLLAADRLLRSGGFALTVLDLRHGGAEPFTARGRDRSAAGAIPLAVQVRLAGLAKRQGATLLCLQRPSPRTAEGSLASLRARVSRLKIRAGRYRCVLQVSKDKRLGREWEWEQVLRGPVGLC
ncbi:MAG: recombinase A [Planctomycetota bacterium]